MKRIVRTIALSADEKERAALTPADYLAAGVEVPNWLDEPVPSLETWRRWQDSQNRALAYRRANARER